MLFCASTLEEVNTWPWLYRRYETAAFCCFCLILTRKFAWSELCLCSITDFKNSRTGKQNNSVTDFNIVSLIWRMLFRWTTYSQCWERCLCWGHFSSCSVAVSFWIQTMREKCERGGFGEGRRLYQVMITFKRRVDQSWSTLQQWNQNKDKKNSKTEWDKTNNIKKKQKT